MEVRAECSAIGRVLHLKQSALLEMLDSDARLLGAVKAPLFVDLFRLKRHETVATAITKGMFGGNESSGED